jgi:hypothetical protein
MQGFLFSEPVRASEMLRILEPRGSNESASLSLQEHRCK